MLIVKWEKTGGGVLIGGAPSKTMRQGYQESRHYSPVGQGPDGGDLFILALYLSSASF